MKNKIKNGFTLIELLLVLALITIMLGFLVLGLRQHAENARINKSALEIEQVLQAAITYNANKGKWPDDNSTQPCTPDTNSDFVKNYLPNGQAQSSLGYFYCWSAKGINKQLFSVALQVPDNSSSIARQIAAHLPNAIITDEPNGSSSEDCKDPQKPCFVRTEIAANTNTDQAGRLLIVGMGNCAKGAEEANVPDRENCKALLATLPFPQDQTERFQISFPACPPNYETKPKIIVTPNFNTMPGINASDFGLKFMRLQAAADYSTCVINKNNQESCQFNLQIQTCIHTNCQAVDIMNQGSRSATATVGASYVVACVPKTANQSKKVLF